MPRVDQHREAEIRQAIRFVIATNPMISSRGIVRELLAMGYKTASGEELDNEYVQKLARRLNVEGLRGVGTADLDQRIMEARERFDMIVSGLFRIAYWKWEYMQDGVSMPTPAERVMAFNALAKMDTTMMSLEMDAGIFKRNLGTIEVEHKTIDPELARPMIIALQNYGIAEPEKKDAATIPSTSGASG